LDSSSQLFVIIPAYNEAASLRAFVQELHRVHAAHFANNSLQLMIVNDGSTDASEALIDELSQAYAQPPFCVGGLHLTKNFGHQGALHAGLSFAFSKSKPSDYFILMDADLQHPPDQLPAMLECLKQGYHHVQMVRRPKAGDGRSIKAFFSRFFYRFFERMTALQLPAGGSDFRGLSYSIVDAFLKLPEVDRFNRGLLWWLGYRRIEIPYDVADRHAGQSKYSWWRMLSLAVTGVTSFSSAPLNLILGASTLFAFVFCLLYFLYECYQFLILRKPFSIGWPSLVFLVTFWGGLLSLGQLLLAVYVSKIFHETKARPSFIIKSVSQNGRTTDL
jgi:glycosyltransferase involved in cell wall biosynthesis